MIQFKAIYLKENHGLGNALRVALENCSYNLVARMDSDDISVPCRFQTQLESFIENPAEDIVGGFITEFVGEPGNVIGERRVELTDHAIKLDAKKRCPMNHVTVMFKKSAVDAAGGYLDWYCNEDYYLWIRMLKVGCRFANVPRPLVNVRTGADMSFRRGGWKYFRSEQLLQKYMKEQGVISSVRYFGNIAIRFAGEYLAPNYIRQYLYRLIRKKHHPEKYEINIESDKGSPDIEYPPFSVAISVYKKDNPRWFDIALESVIVNQTVKPSEVVLVVDGPVPGDTIDVINKYINICEEISQ